MIQPRTLQQRTLFFILIPTFILLLGLSLGGYVFVRSLLLNQLGETAISKLQRTAHQIDMRMRQPKDLLRLLQGPEDGVMSRQIFDFILRKIDDLEGVAAINVEWFGKNPLLDNPSGGNMMPMMYANRYTLDRIEIGLPKYDSRVDNRTVSLVSELQDASGNTLGRVEILIDFDEFIEKVITAPWWKSNKAYLIDGKGNVLASTNSDGSQHIDLPLATFGMTNELEKNTLAAIQHNSSGMVFGRGSPPAEVSGYYRLAEAPWTMVVMAPGEKVLQPIIHFKLIYILAITISTFVILVLIRVATNTITSRIKEITNAAENLADGRFGPPLSVSTRDEVGELTKCFNRMTQQLRQRLRLKEAIGVAREVQQNFLPHTVYSVDGIDVGGVSRYCDETGGDYYDIIKFPLEDQKVGVVVGDVVGHGIGAALLMATIRAALRCRIFQKGSLNRVIEDVNTLLCDDTSRTGNFVTLFYLEVDRKDNSLRWVRGGHDPAIVYYPKNQSFFELKGEGVALGIDPDWRFESNRRQLQKEEQLILIASDGVWEVRNTQGEQFGKERIKQVMAASCESGVEVIIDSLIDEILKFKGDASQDDDITLVIIKIQPGRVSRDA
ncbi:MAG: SpoIIE family protein phosphatase [Desulforhopalus sp.]